MADLDAQPTSPLSILGSLFGGINNARQNHMAQALQGGYRPTGTAPGGATLYNNPVTPGGGAGPYGSSAPQWHPGGPGFGQYEGNIHTAANPMGRVKPHLGAANPVPMPRPRPGPPGTGGLGQAFAGGAPPVPFMGGAPPVPFRGGIIPPAGGFAGPGGPTSPTPPITGGEGLSPGMAAGIAPGQNGPAGGFAGPGGPTPPAMTGGESLSPGMAAGIAPGMMPGGPGQPPNMMQALGMMPPII